MEGKFGVKIKDKRGTEVEVIITGDYLADENVSTHGRK